MLGNRETEMTFTRRCRDLRRNLRIGETYEMFHPSMEKTKGNTPDMRYSKCRCIQVTRCCAAFEFHDRYGKWCEAFTYPQLIMEGKIREAW